MKITIEVSDENEGTSSPWWIILDPHQMMKPDLYDLASMITGPFFSRDNAETYLQTHRYNFSGKACVYCHSGCYAKQYDNAYRAAENMEQTKPLEGGNK